MPNLVPNPFHSGDTTVSGRATKGVTVKCYDASGALVGSTTADRNTGEWSIPIGSSNPPFTIKTEEKEIVVVVVSAEGSS